MRTIVIVVSTSLNQCFRSVFVVVVVVSIVMIFSSVFGICVVITTFQYLHSSDFRTLYSFDTTTTTTENVANWNLPFLNRAKHPNRISFIAVKSFFKDQIRPPTVRAQTLRNFHVFVAIATIHWPCVVNNTFRFNSYWMTAFICPTVLFIK